MEPEPSSKKSEATKVKIAGAWSGVLEVELAIWTLPMLREEVAKRSNSPPECINLICGGKILRGGESLIELGLKNNAKILASRVSADHGKSLKDEFLAEEERSRRLSRIRAAAVALAKRHAESSLPVEDFNIELEDQSGQKVQLGSETDQQGVMMGLMLHANAKQLIKKHKYKDALDVLAMGEEAFSLCDPKVIEMTDNIPILQIDTVWCYFMLRDISWLSMAGVRLAKAREGLERSHGKDSTRVRLLQAGRHPELAIYLRLELLEGVVAYHSGLFEQSQKALTSAQVKYLQLQIPDEALSLLMSMGYNEMAAKRALRMTNQDVERAVDFLVEEKERKARRNQEDLERRKEIMEQKRYGMTTMKRAVNLQRLNELVSIGFDKPLAAEALRRNENDTQKALDDLTNPEAKSIIQLYVDSKKRKRQKQPADADIEDLISMGFERARVMAALRASDTKEEALSILIGDQIPNPTDTVNDSVASTIPLNDNMDSTIPPMDNQVTGSSSGIKNTEERDEEMEDEIAQELSGDPLSDYDIEVTKEGEAITEYMALLASSTATVKDFSKTA
ncbi:ubiquitin-associated (UBA)/TS-N domain-containing protein [Tasmannia lanceolata]|uniref:ubiquitin-associated (UBA)/TS-N domain-containing protein n=1 Tax=Tasmannia lanceolata TaxID=3420 RepID=UPI0040635346